MEHCFSHCGPATVRRPGCVARIGMYSWPAKTSEPLRIGILLQAALVLAHLQFTSIGILFLHTLAVLVQLAQNSSITLRRHNFKSDEECLVSIHIQRDTGGKGINVRSGSQKVSPY